MSRATDATKDLDAALESGNHDKAQAAIRALNEAHGDHARSVEDRPQDEPKPAVKAPAKKAAKKTA